MFFFCPGWWHSTYVEEPDDEANANAAGEAEAEAGAPCRLINGTAVAKDIRAEVRGEVDALYAAHGVRPGLAVVLVGSRADSQAYVRMKKKACMEVGIVDVGSEFPAHVDQHTLLEKIAELNADPRVHGILVQLPLPAHIDEETVLYSILPEKDVDGLHPFNTAQLASTRTHGGGKKDGSAFGKDADFSVACTPQGCIELLDRAGVAIRGANAVVVGRSNIVGIPSAMLLMQRDATVTIVHSKTKNAAAVCREADIVIAAMGRPGVVDASWIKPGAAVIDVGINSVADTSKKRGYRLVGDVDFAAVKEVAGHLTPVPGGVGPMTIAMLLRNTLNAAKRHHEPADHEKRRLLSEDDRDRGPGV